jgi:hypothetical protein
VYSLAPVWCTSPWCILFSLLLHLCQVYIPHLRENMRLFTFWTWLPSLTMMFSSWAQEAQTCILSGGREQEGRGSKHAWRNSSCLEKPITKNGGGVAQDVGPEFKPQYPSPSPPHKKALSFCKTAGVA